MFRKKYKTDKNLALPILFKRCIDDGFAVSKTSRKDFDYWASEFLYGDSFEFMDLVIFKGETFMNTGKFDVSIFKERENKYMHIPVKSGHVKHTIKNLILGN